MRVEFVLVSFQGAAQPFGIGNRRGGGNAGHICLFLLTWARIVRRVMLSFRRSNHPGQQVRW